MSMLLYFSSLQLTVGQNKLKCLSLANFFELALYHVRVRLGPKVVKLFMPIIYEFFSKLEC